MKADLLAALQALRQEFDTSFQRALEEAQQWPDEPPPPPPPPPPPAPTRRSIQGYRWRLGVNATADQTIARATELPLSGGVFVNSFIGVVNPRAGVFDFSREARVLDWCADHNMTAEIMFQWKSFGHTVALAPAPFQRVQIKSDPAHMAPIWRPDCAAALRDCLLEVARRFDSHPGLACVTTTETAPGQQTMIEANTGLSYRDFIERTDAGLRTIYSAASAFRQTTFGACINWWPEPQLAALMNHTHSLGMSFHSTDSIDTAGSRYRLQNQPNRAHTAEVSMHAIDTHRSLANAVAWCRNNGATGVNLLDWLRPSTAQPWRPTAQQTYEFARANPI